MSQNKKSRPVLAHRNGQKTEHWKLLTPIVPLLRAAVKMAAVTLGLYILAAVAATLRHGPRPGPMENDTRSMSDGSTPAWSSAAEIVFAATSA